GVFDPASGHLFVTERRTGPNRVAEIDPANGTEISSFALPFNSGQAGLTIHPTSGNLWYGSDQSTNVVEMTRSGTVLRTINLASQGINQAVIDGLAIDNQGNLYVAANQGVVYKTTV